MHSIYIYIYICIYIHWCVFTIYFSLDMILNFKIDTNMEPKSCKNGSKMSRMAQMAPKWSPNPPLETSKWARRPQGGSRGAKLVSMRLQELPKASQDGPKMAHMAPNMTPRRAKMTPKGPKVAPRWAQDGPKRPQKGANRIPKWDIVRF